MSKKSLEVTILGELYTLITDEGEEHIAQAAGYADRVMRVIERSGIDDRKKVAVLATLQMASELLKKEHASQSSKEETDRVEEWAKRQNERLSDL